MLANIRTCAFNLSNCEKKMNTATLSTTMCKNFIEFIDVEEKEGEGAHDEGIFG